MLTMVVRQGYRVASEPLTVEGKPAVIGRGLGESDDMNIIQSLAITVAEGEFAPGLGKARR